MIGAIYDCVLDLGRWETTLDEIRSRLDCANCTQYALDLLTGALRIQKMWDGDCIQCSTLPGYRTFSGGTDAGGANGRSWHNPAAWVMRQVVGNEVQTCRR